MINTTQHCLVSLQSLVLLLDKLLPIIIIIIVVEFITIIINTTTTTTTTTTIIIIIVGIMHTSSSRGIEGTFVLLFVASFLFLHFSSTTTFVVRRAMHASMNMYGTAQSSKRSTTCSAFLCFKPSLSLSFTHRSLSLFCTYFSYALSSFLVVSHSHTHFLIVQLKASVSTPNDPQSSVGARPTQTPTLVTVKYFHLCSNQHHHHPHNLMEGLS